MTHLKSKMAPICRVVDLINMKKKFSITKNILCVEMPLNVFNTFVLIWGLNVGSPQVDIYIVNLKLLLIRVRRKEVDYT